MLVSQQLMLLAVGLLLIAAFASRSAMKDKPWLRRIFGALIVQATLGVALSFSHESLGLSLLFGTLILVAVGYMAIHCQPEARDRLAK